MNLKCRKEMKNLFATFFFWISENIMELIERTDVKPGTVKNLNLNPRNTARYCQESPDRWFNTVRTGGPIALEYPINEGEKLCICVI